MVHADPRSLREAAENAKGKNKRRRRDMLPRAEAWHRTRSLFPFTPPHSLREIFAASSLSPRIPAFRAAFAEGV